MKIGYARVSSNDQNLSLQLAALKDVGCEKIFSDKASGGSKERQGLTEVLNFLRKGDTLYIWKLDRLGRSVLDVVDITAKLNERGVNIVFLQDGIDTTTPGGRFYFHIMAALAEMEREQIRERTLAGQREAKKRGSVFGRPCLLTEKQKIAAKKLLYQGMPYKEVAATFNVSKSYIYRLLSASQLGKNDG